MKLLKHIFLFFSLFIILEFSYANSFASDFSNKELCVSKIEFAETGKLISDSSEFDLDKNYIFEHSFRGYITYRSISFRGGYAELVVSWKVLDDLGDDVARILRKDPVTLSKTGKFDMSVIGKFDDIKDEL